MKNEDLKKIRQQILNLRVKDFQNQKLMIELQRLNIAIVDVMAMIHPHKKPFEIRDKRFKPENDE